MDVEAIRQGLKRPGKTQKGLADAMGVDPAAISRLLAGDRQLKAHEIPKVQAYLEGTNLASPRRTSSSSVEKQDRLPVLGMAECGPDGWGIWNGDVIDTIPMPTNLAGVPKAYAVFITGVSMEPRYHAGEVAHIHPYKPVTVGCYVLIQKKPNGPGEPPLAVIKQLVRRSGAKVTVGQLNPPKTFDLKADDIVMHRVVGSSEG